MPDAKLAVADTVTDQRIDSTLNQRLLNTLTPIGLEHSREIDQGNGAGSFTPKQTTTWEYFPNGKLSTLTTTVSGQSQPIEQHTVSYLDQAFCQPPVAASCGIYVDGNRVQDQYSLRPGGSASSPCFPGTCIARYTYDPRDRLVQNDDGHGGVTKYSLDGNGNILSQTQGANTTTNKYNGNQLQQSTSGGQTRLYW